MLNKLKQLFRRNKGSENSVPEVKLDFVPFEELEEWKNIKVYDRSNSETKQVYYDHKYLCSCSSEEAIDIKNFIVELLLEDVPLEAIKEML